MLASLAGGALLLAAAPVAATQAPVAPIPPALTLEEKAGCGIALTLLEEAMVRIPAAMDDVDPEERGMVKMFVRSMGEEGRTLMTEAFVEGASLQMTSMQVYQAGLTDLFATLGPIDWKDQASSGEAFMKQFVSRCIR